MTPDYESGHESLDSNHGHEYLVRELRVLPWDILRALVGISTRTRTPFGVSQQSRGPNRNSCMHGECSLLSVD